MPYLSTCTSVFYTPHLCKCILFDCCVSLHKNSTTSWVKQMFYCRARQLLKWLASIWVPLLQLAATAEPEQSISMRRVGLDWERWEGFCSTEYGNRLPGCYSLREDDKLWMGDSGEFRSEGSDIPDITDTQWQGSHLTSNETQIWKLAYLVAPADKHCYCKQGSRREGGRVWGQLVASVQSACVGFCVR